jgi:putative heme iron utilization protein
VAPSRAELGFAIRQLMRSSRSASLSTALASADGWPYASLVTVAIDTDGAPLLLFSELSDHTRNLKADGRAALLFERASRHANPQRGPRVSVLGRIRPTRKPEHARRFLDMHPEAEMYAGFGDFGFYRMSIDRAHWVGGFARAQWLSGRFVAADAKAAKAIAAAAPGIIAHMNDDHADAVENYATRLLGRSGGGWRMIGVDPDGADLALEGRRARLGFDEMAENVAQVRDRLVQMAGQARAGNP